MIALSRNMVPMKLFFPLIILMVLILGSSLDVRAQDSRMSDSVRRLQERAEKGDPAAQHLLGRAYYEGNGVSRDHTKALRWLITAEKQGYVPLGRMSESDRIEPFSSTDTREKAKKAFEKSLERSGSTGNIKEQAICFVGLAAICSSEGKNEETLRYLEKALDAYRKSDDVPGEMIALLEMAKTIPDEKQRLEYAKQALAAARKAGSATGRRDSLEVILSLHRNSKQLQEDLDFLKRGLETEKEENDLAGMAQFLVKIARVHNSMRDYNGVKASCEEAAQIARKDGRIESLISVCDGCRWLDHPNESYPIWLSKWVPLIEQALAQSRVAGDTWAEMMILHRLAIVCLFSRESNKVIQSWEQASALARRNQHHDEEYYFLNILEHSLLRQGEYKRTLECNERKLVVARQSGQISREIETFRGRAKLYSTLGRHEKAISEYEKALERCNQESGKDSLRYTRRSLLHETAKAYLESARYRKAIELCGKSLQLEEDAGVLETMGEAYRGLGETDKAIEYFLGAWWTRDGRPPFGLAEIYLDRGRAEDAQAMAKDGRWEDLDLGLFYLLKGDYGKAKENYEKALERSESAGYVDPLFAAYTGLGKMYEAMEDYRKAEDYYERSKKIVERLRSNLPPGAGSGFDEVKINGFRRSDAAEGFSRVRTKMNQTDLPSEESRMRPRF